MERSEQTLDRLLGPAATETSEPRLWGVQAQDSLADPDMLYDSESSLKDAFGALYRVCSSGSDNTCGQFARESAGEPIYQLLDVRDVYCGPCASPRAKPHPSRHPEPRRFRRAARRLRRPRRRAPARAQGPAVRRERADRGPRGPHAVATSAAGPAGAAARTKHASSASGDRGGQRTEARREL